MPLPPPQTHDRNRIEALLQRDTGSGEPLRWVPAGGPLVITWNFMTAATVDIDGEVLDFTSFSPLTAGQQAGVRRALGHYDDLLNVSFRYAPGAGAGADLRFGNVVPLDDLGNPSESLFGVTVYHYERGAGRLLDARVLYNSNRAVNFDQSPGGEGYLVTLHELGHALGLDHAGASAGETLPPALRPGFDSQQFSIMSYHGHPGVPPGVFPETPMLYDVLALEALYGRGPAFHSGNDVYRLPAGRVSVQTLVDRGGVDLIDAGNQGRGAVIDLRPGTFSRVGPAGEDNLAIAFGTIIENANGTAYPDVLVGNVAANALRGGAGGDELFGLGGTDLLVAGAGRDLLSGGAGADDLRGGPGPDTLIGEGGADRLSGGGGHDLLIGGAGRDLLSGGAGRDVFELAATSEFGDRIQGFARGADRIHLVDLLEGFEPVPGALDGFVRTQPQGPHTRLLVDPDGGGDGFLDAALVLNLAAALPRAALIEPDVVEIAL